MVAIVLATTGAAIWGVGRAWQSLESSDADITSTTLATITWDSDAADTGRELEVYTRQQIADDYARAWLEWNLAYRNETTAGIPTYFSGDARAALIASVSHALESSERIYQVDTSHQLQLHLYSADGTIVSFTDAPAMVTQFVLDSSGKLVLNSFESVSYDVVMKLEDGNWRVDNWVRTAATPLPSTPPAAGGNEIVAADGTRLSLDDAAFDVYGINYYPRDTPWDRFWTEYDPAAIDADFTRIAGDLQLNTIRIFIPYEQFGGPNVSGDMLGRLDDLLRRARDHRLKVIVTLFDFFGAQYDPLRWPDTDRHLTGIVSRFRDNSTILAWDLKNEPDLDPTEEAIVNAWIEHTAWYVRSLDSAHLITVGWANADSAIRASDAVDVVSFHFYKPADQLAPAITRLNAAVSTKPLLLSEFGLPTWNSAIFPGGHTEAEQAAYYADVLSTSRENGIAGTVAWTLYDFPSIPASIGGRWPWQSEPERHLGVIRADGMQKPAADLLAPNANLDVARPGTLERFRKPFWMTWFVVGVLLAIGAWGVRLLVRRAAKRARE